MPNSWVSCRMPSSEHEGCQVKFLSISKPNKKLSLLKNVGFLTNVIYVTINTTYCGAL